MKHLIGSLAILLVGVSALSACPPAVVSSYSYAAPVSYSSYAPVVNTVVEKVIETIPVAVFQPLAVAVPTYTAAYTPPAAVAPAAAAAPAPAATPVATAKTTAPAAAAAPASGDTKAILEAIQHLNERLDRLEKRSGEGPVPAEEAKAREPPQLPARDAIASLFASRCASCHETRVADASGGGFVLLEGERLAKLDDRQIRRVLTQVYTGRMPKATKLSDQEVNEVVKWADQQK